MLATDIDSATASAAAAGGAEKRAYVKRIFSEIAPRYDLLNHVLSLNIDRRWRRKAIATLGVERDLAGRYLDLCAGTMDVAAECRGCRDSAAWSSAPISPSRCCARARRRYGAQRSRR